MLWVLYPVAEVGIRPCRRQLEALGESSVLERMGHQCVQREVTQLMLPKAWWSKVPEALRDALPSQWLARELTEFMGASRGSKSWGMRCVETCGVPARGETP